MVLLFHLVPFVTCTTNQSFFKFSRFSKDLWQFLCWILTNSENCYFFPQKDILTKYLTTKIEWNVFCCVGWIKNNKMVFIVVVLYKSQSHKVYDYFADVWTEKFVYWINLTKQIADDVAVAIFRIYTHARTQRIDHNIFLWLFHIR